MVVPVIHGPWQWDKAARERAAQDDSVRGNGAEWTISTTPA